MELAHLVKAGVERATEMRTEIIIDHSPRKDRSYRLDNNKVKKILLWQPRVSVEQSVTDMITKIKEYGYDDFSNPRYYNIQWMKKRKSSQLLTKPYRTL